MIVVAARKISPGPQPQPASTLFGWLVTVEDTSTPNGKRGFECHWIERRDVRMTTPATLRIPIALYVYDPNDGRRLIGLVNADVVSFAEQLP